MKRYEIKYKTEMQLGWFPNTEKQTNLMGVTLIKMPLILSRPQHINLKEDLFIFHNKLKNSPIFSHVLLSIPLNIV